MTQTSHFLKRLREHLRNDLGNGFSPAPALRQSLFWQRLNAKIGALLNFRADYSTFRILLSRRSRGGAKLGWVLINLVFPIFGWGVFLVMTQSAKDRFTQTRNVEQYLRT